MAGEVIWLGWLVSGFFPEVSGLEDCWELTCKCFQTTIVFSNRKVSQSPPLFFLSTCDFKVDTLDMKTKRSLL